MKVMTMTSSIPIHEYIHVIHHILYAVNRSKRNMYMTKNSAWTAWSRSFCTILYPTLSHCKLHLKIGEIFFFFYHFNRNFPIANNNWPDIEYAEGKKWKINTTDNENEKLITKANTWHMTQATQNITNQKKMSQMIKKIAFDIYLSIHINKLLCTHHNHVWLDE